MHVIDDRPVNPVFLGYGSGPDGPHVYEQVIGQFPDKATLAHTQDCLMKFDIGF